MLFLKGALRREKPPIARNRAIEALRTRPRALTLGSHIYRFIGHGARTRGRGFSWGSDAGAGFTALESVFLVCDGYRRCLFRLWF